MLFLVLALFQVGETALLMWRPTPCTLETEGVHPCTELVAFLWASIPIHLH